MATYQSGVIQIPIQPTPAELARLNVPLLGVLPKWRTPDEQLKWNANLGGATATGEAVTADVLDTSNDNVDQASLSIAQYRLRSSFSVLETKYTQAAARGVDALANLIDYSAMGAKREILQTLGRAIITGTGNAVSGGVIGMEAPVAESTETTPGTPDAKGSSTAEYAGLDPADPGYELWTNLVYNGFGTISMKKINGFEADFLQGSTTGVPGSYDMVVMSPTTALAYADVLGEPSMSILGQIDLGYGVKTFKGRPVIEDPNIPDGEAHFVDSNAVRLYSFDQGSGPGMSDEQPTEGLLLYSKQLPELNPQRLTFALFGMFQLQIRERRCHGVIKGISV